MPPPRRREDSRPWVTALALGLETFLVVTPGEVLEARLPLNSHGAQDGPTTVTPSSEVKRRKAAWVKG